MPISKKPARRVVVKYPPQGGYSPGDTWELYVGKDHRLEEFVFARAGAGAPKGYTGTWEGYEKAGPLLLSRSRGHDGRWKVRAGLLFGRGGESGGIRQVGKCAVSVGAFGFGDDCSRLSARGSVPLLSLTECA